MTRVRQLNGETPRSLKIRSAGALTFTHFPQLDGFRGFAAILVLVGHALEFSKTPLQTIGAPTAQLGVMLFFVLSGFLITGLLYRERATTERIGLGRFYARRVLRLAPAMLLFLGVCFILASQKLITDIPNYEFIVCLVYLRDIYGRSLSLAHLWSLALEEQFYLIWPWVMKFVRRDRLLPFAITATVLIAIFRMVGIKFALFNYQSGVFYERPWFRFDSILIGCCLALSLLEIHAHFERLAWLASRVPTTASWSFLLIWTAWGENFTHTFYITLQTIGAALVLCQLIVVSQGSLYGLFSAGWLRYCGRISYSLYLWQQLFLVVKYPAWGMLRLFPINLVTPILCAMLSYHLLEAPALRLRKLFEISTNPADPAG
jgi:peptidoglycan/LPS O-acetylase OafA/YrhL